MLLEWNFRSPCGLCFGAADPLGNVIFKKAKMVYTGTTETPSGAMMDDVFFTQWSDPDLGTFTDDYVGCDVDLSLVMYTMVIVLMEYLMVFTIYLSQLGV